MKKKLTGLIALLMAVSIMTTACGNDIENVNPDVTLPEETTVTTTVATTEATTEATTTTAPETTTVATTTTPKATTAAPATTSPVTTTTVAATTTAPVTTTAAPATTSNNTNGLGRAHYNALNADEKVIYDELVAAIKGFKTNVTFSKATDSDTVMKIYKSVFYHEPTLFWMSGSLSGVTSDSVSMNFLYTPTEAKDMQAKIDAAVNKIIAKIPADASQAKKVQIIHDTLAANTVYSKDNKYSSNMYGPLVGGVAQCQGYAQAVAYVCTKAGIENCLVAGTVPTGTHEWVKVYVGNKWYNVDLTFDDPKNRTEPNYFAHRYLLIPDSQIPHTVNDTYTPPVANSLDHNYFVTNGLYATKKDQTYNMMKNEIIKSAKTKRGMAEFKCANKDIWMAARVQLAQSNAKLMQEANAAGTNKITKLVDYSDEKTLTIQVNITY